IERVRHTMETGKPHQIAPIAVPGIDRGITEHYQWHIYRILHSEGDREVVCYFQDTTAQVRAEEAIAGAEEQRRRAAEGLRAIAARAPCILWYAEVEDRGDPWLHWTLRMADVEAAQRFLP